MIKRLPIPDPDGLIQPDQLTTTGAAALHPGRRSFPISSAKVRSRIVCAYNGGGTLPVEANGRPTLALVAFVSGRCFDAFGVMPSIGRADRRRRRAALDGRRGSRW